MPVSTIHFVVAAKPQGVHTAVCGRSTVNYSLLFSEVSCKSCRNHPTFKDMQKLTDALVVEEPLAATVAPAEVEPVSIEEARKTRKAKVAKIVPTTDLQAEMDQLVAKSEKLPKPAKEPKIKKDKVETLCSVCNLPITNPRVIARGFTAHRSCRKPVAPVEVVEPAVKVKKTKTTK